MLVYEELTHEILGAATEVHKQIGAGLLESACEECLCRELSLRGLSFQRQVPLAIAYKGVKLDCGYKLDLNGLARFREVQAPPPPFGRRLQGSGNLPRLRKAI